MGFGHFGTKEAESHSPGQRPISANLFGWSLSAWQGLKEISRWRKPPEITENHLPRQGLRTYHNQMPSTHLALHYHLVFSTKDRVAAISDAWRPRLHAFLGGVVNQLEGIPQKVGGVSDHVHLLIGLKATHRLADVLREIKSVSSRWVHEEIGVKSFSWQEGYGAFTVSSTQIGAVIDYIARQDEHHRAKSFQDEYREFLERAGVQYEERFLW